MGIVTRPMTEFWISNHIHGTASIPLPELIGIASIPITELRNSNHTHDRDKEQQSYA